MLEECESFKSSNYLFKRVWETDGDKRSYDFVLAISEKGVPGKQLRRVQAFTNLEFKRVREIAEDFSWERTTELYSNIDFESEESELHFMGSKKMLGRITGNKDETVEVWVHESDVIDEDVSQYVVEIIFTGIDPRREEENYTVEKKYLHLTPGDFQTIVEETDDWMVSDGDSSVIEFRKSGSGKTRWLYNE